MGTRSSSTAVMSATQTTRTRGALFVILCCSHLLGNRMCQAQTLMDILNARPELLKFRAVVIAAGAHELLMDQSQTFTIFAPKDDAMNDNENIQLYTKGIDTTPPRWHLHLEKAVKNHIVPAIDGADALTEETIFNAKDTELISLQDALTVSQFRRKIQDSGIEVPDLRASNGIMHIVDEVIEANFMQADLSVVENQYELGYDWQDPPRVGLVDVVNHVGQDARDFYSIVRESGSTQVGCRRRAFNKMGLDYLPQTINGSPSVKEGEFMNDTFKEETLDEFIKFGMLPQNYYYDDFPANYVELTYGVNDCSHMWITKSRAGQLCYNDGCSVHEQDGTVRQYVASNGVGLIVDKCIVCSGIGMLVNYASDFTFYNVYDISQFLISSEWNLRNLSLSVGDGGPVTLFAAIDSGWGEVNLEDVTRLSTDKWKRHQWDFLSHMMVQGLYTKQDLLDLYGYHKGKYNLTSLAGQPLFFDYDEQRSQLTVQGGDVIFEDIKGVDGWVHFTTEVPLPLSMTDTVYDVAAKIANYSTQITLIDTVFLRQDMKRLLPLTAMFSPNEEWEGKILQLEDISKTVLESHMIENLMWCETLRSMDGQRVESLNGQLWFVSVNEDNMPCFDTMQVFGGASMKSCVTKCDILARNGIVHELDSIMMFDVAETIPPDPEMNVPPSARAPGPPKITEERPDYFDDPNKPAPKRENPNGEGGGTGEEAQAQGGFGDGGSSGAATPALRGVFLGVFMILPLLMNA